MSNPAAKAELDRYFDWIEQHLPNWLARFLHWLRQPQMLIARIFVCLLLIVGGVLSFLPILGFWMLPLGPDDHRPGPAVPAAAAGARLPVDRAEVGKLAQQVAELTILQGFGISRIHSPRAAAA